MVVNCGRHGEEQRGHRVPLDLTRLDHLRLSTAGYKSPPLIPKNLSWATGTPVVNVKLVAKLQRIASTVEQTNLMKANTKKNLTSVVMLVILSPFLALAILVSIKTLGMMNNEALLLMLTLLSAVLSGINGFGRRTATAVQLSPANAKANGADPSTVSVMFAGLSK